ncbi:hypothetical protein Dimus_008770 [Dionaea muscipula]
MTSSGSVDGTPFLSGDLYGATLGEATSTTSRTLTGGVQSVRTQRMRQVVRFLGRASTSRRMTREPSMAVREAAAQQIEERQSDWAYSRPVVLLDVFWNLTFVVVSAVFFLLSRDEVPQLPLRLWIAGYAVMCAVHAFCVGVEFCRRRRRRRRRVVGSFEDSVTGEFAVDSVFMLREVEESSTITRHLESANTMFSFVWWVIGFYWICAGGQGLQQESPHLYWLCMLFLGFDVVFVSLCVVLASVTAVAVCCCLPCMIAILYALADQAGALKEDIEQLPKYKFRRIDDEEKMSGDVQGSAGGIMTECATNSPNQRVLSAVDAECCICLNGYEHGVELRQLPCGHHFHCACIDKWLYINSTCPLCKYDILKRSREGEA